MQNIKHIFFDLDHTLWDFDKNSELSFKQIFSERNINLSYEDFIREYLPVNLKYWKLYREEKISKSDLRYRRLKDAFNALNFTVSDAFINQISADYINYLPNYNNLIDDCISVLNYLQPKYNLHIITNGFREVQNKKLEQSNIKPYFDVVVTSESVGVKKPNPKIFDFALKESRATPKESIMIGDSFEADVMGAFNVGILPIHFTNNKEINSNNFVSVKRLTDLKQYL